MGCLGDARFDRKKRQNLSRFSFCEEAGCFREGVLEVSTLPLYKNRPCLFKNAPRKLSRPSSTHPAAKASHRTYFRSCSRLFAPRDDCMAVNRCVQTQCHKVPRGGRRAAHFSLVYACAATICRSECPGVLDAKIDNVLHVSTEACRERRAFLPF